MHPGQDCFFQSTVGGVAIVVNFAYSSGVNSPEYRVLRLSERIACIPGLARWRALDDYERWLFESWGWAPRSAPRLAVARQLSRVGRRAVQLWVV